MGEVTQFDYLTSELILFNKEKLRLTQKVKEYCQNKENPVDKRWSLFISSNFGEHNSFIQRFKSICKIEKFVELDRYQHVNCNWLIDSYKDYLSEQLYDELELTCDNDTNEYFNFIKTEVDPKVDIFKEEILQLFVKSFTYDW